MQIVTRLKTKDEIKKLNQLGFDVFCLDTKFTAKKVAEFSLSEIKEIVLAYPKRIYVLINKMIHESDLDEIDQFFKELRDLPIAGIVIIDFTVYLLAKKHQLEHVVIYQPGTYNTDTYSVEYLAERNIKGMTISREITLDEIKKFNPLNIELSIIGHGYLDMFYSKRELITNYFIHKDMKDKEAKHNFNYKLNEEMRETEFYPILEDDFGTHIFRSKKLISYDEFIHLTPLIKDFFIERIFIDDDELYDSIKLYKNEISLDSFLEKYTDYDSGFYYKRTEKVKGELNEN